MQGLCLNLSYIFVERNHPFRSPWQNTDILERLQMTGNNSKDRKRENTVLTVLLFFVMTMSKCISGRFFILHEDGAQKKILAGTE